MMYSDYLALYACAFSILYVPFMVIAQLRFSHIMQSEGYDSRAYFAWIKRNFLLAVVPVIGISIIVAVAEVAMKAYIYNSIMMDINLFAGYILWVLFVAVFVVIVYHQYIKRIKIESEVTPLSCSPRLVALFTLSCVFVCVITLAANLLPDADRLVFFIPATTPFWAPLANIVSSKLVKEPAVT